MIEREALEHAIRYPFTSRARKIVEENGFDLEKPPFEVLDMARQRLEDGVKGSLSLFTPSSSEEYMLTELFSYPVSKILASLTKDRSIIHRYSKAESERIYRELIRNKDSALMSELADELGLKIKDGKIHFTDYIKASPSRQPLVNARLQDGFVEIDDEIMPEIIANTFRNRLAAELNKTIKVPKVYQENAKGVKQELKQTFAEEDLGPMKIEAFPPCIKALIQDARAGEHLAHQPRFVLSSFMVNVHMPIDQIVQLFSNTPNFNPKKTRYYVEYSAGKRGSGVAYTPPSCKKMDFYGLCRNRDGLCDRVGHPLSYYSRKKRARK